jgi:hypothetical protein
VSDSQLFDFESDFVSGLRCIPMAVRLKLDTSGIKLSLEQWSRFTQEDRHRLLMTPCAGAAEIEAYRRALVDLVALRANDVAKSLADPPCGQWDNRRQAPVVVVDFARTVGLCPPTNRQWRALTRLQRFALIKLTRDSHDNVNFVPAMNEFGLATPLRSGSDENAANAARSLDEGRSP